MPRDRDFKKLVRRRMRKTGERYSSARARLLSLHGRRQVAPGGTAMVPFETFTDPARDALRLAQEEAYDSERGYIGSEHLLLGLLREEAGVAGRALRSLGVSIDGVRAAIAGRFHAPDASLVDQIRPTAEVKAMLDAAAREEKRASGERVGTGELLQAMLEHREALGAEILAQLGVTLESACAEMGAIVGAAGPEGSQAQAGAPVTTVPRLGLPATGGLMTSLDRARRAALQEHAFLLRSDHLLAAMTGPDTALPEVVGLLGGVGADLDALRSKLRPPQPVTDLEVALFKLGQEMTEALTRQDYALARRLRDQRQDLRDQLATALDSWQAGWGATGR